MKDIDAFAERLRAHLESEGVDVAGIASRMPAARDYSPISEETILAIVRDEEAFDAEKCHNVTMNGRPATREADGTYSAIVKAGEAWARWEFTIENDDD